MSVALASVFIDEKVVYSRIQFGCFFCYLGIINMAGKTCTALGVQSTRA